MVLILNLGFDRGNARTNVAAVADGGTFVELDVSSMVSEGNLKRYQMVKSGSGSAESIGLSELMVEHEGSVYFLADLASHGKNPTTGFGDKNRYHGKHTRIALMAYSAMMAMRLWPGSPTHDIAVNVVMGVPFRAYQEESEKIVEALSDSYRYCFNGRAYSIHVDTVKVFMEGAGAAIYHGFEKTGTVGIVDSGSLTTNVLRFDGAKAHTEECSSFEIGLATAMDRVSTRFEDKYGRELQEGEKQEILSAYIGQAAYPELHADGKQVSGVDLHEWTKIAIAETGRDRNTEIAKIWSSQSGKVASSFKRVIHVGGGAYYFHPSLQQIISFAELSPEAEKANARGFAVLASQIAQRKALKRA